jgi:hypothetical protein
MVGLTSLEEQVDRDFSRARRKAMLRRIGTRLRRDAASDWLLCFDDLRKIPGALGRIYRGMRTVPVAQIGGSVGRCSEFDRGFMPARASVGERWKRMDRAFHRGEGLPPVSLYEVGGFYYVLDGHHRVSVASYHGVEWVDAHVTEFGASGLWSERRDIDALIEPPKRGELRMREMTNLELVKQRHEERLREAELSRQAKALQETRKRRAGRRSALAWEIQRHAGRLLKFLRDLRSAGQDRKARHMSEKDQSQPPDSSFRAMPLHLVSLYLNERLLARVRDRDRGAKRRHKEQRREKT